MSVACRSRSLRRRLCVSWLRRDTIGVGYNTIRFDDEVTRFMLWRNLFPPYKREFENGCSRWDLIDVVRCAYALRPEGIVWPTDAETGKPVSVWRFDRGQWPAHESARCALGCACDDCVCAIVKETRNRVCLNLR